MPSTKRAAFTLIELLVVIAIIAVLVALLLPAAQKVRESANRTRCQNSLRQIALALHNYHLENSQFPLGTKNGLGPDGNMDPLDRRTWFQQILPYVEQTAVYDNYMAWAKASETLPIVWANGMWNKAPDRQLILSLFMCPSDPSHPKVLTGGPTSTDQQGFHGNYVLCAGSEYLNPDRDGAGPLPRSDGGDLNGMYYYNSKTRIADLADGTSYTLMGSELLLSRDLTSHDSRGRYWNNARQGGVLFSTLYPPNTSVPDRLQWCQPTLRAPCSPSSTDLVFSARSMHPGCVNAMLADGSVRTINNGVNVTIYQGLGTRAGGEVVSDY